MFSGGGYEKLTKDRLLAFVHDCKISRIDSRFSLSTASTSHGSLPASTANGTSVWLLGSWVSNGFVHAHDDARSLCCRRQCIRLDQSRSTSTLVCINNSTRTPTQTFQSCRQFPQTQCQLQTTFRQAQHDVCAACSTSRWRQSRHCRQLGEV